MKRAVLTYIIIIAAMSFFVPLAQASLGEVVLKEDKADVLVTIEVPSPEALFKYAENIAKQIGQEPADIRQEIIKGLFKVNDVKVVEISKPVELVILNPKKFKMPMVLAFYVTDKDKFFASFGGDNLKLNEKTKEAKIREYSKTDTEFDNDAYMKDLEAGKEINFEDYNKEVTSTYYISVVDNVALGAGDMAVMEKAIAAVGKKSDGKRLVSGDIQGIINIESIMAVYGDDIAKATENMPMPQDPNAPIDVGKVFKMYADALIALGKSLDNMQFAANTLDKGDLGLQFAMVPKTGTWLEKMISTQEPKPYDYLAMLPEDATLAYAWNLNLTDDFATVYIKFVQQLMEAMTKNPLSAEDNEKMAEMIRQNFKSMGKGGALSMSMSGAGIDLRGVVEIKDKAQAIKSTKEGLAFVMEKMIKPLMAGKEESFDIKYIDGETPYKGATVNTVLIDVKTDKLKEDEKAMMKKLFGDQIAVYMGYTDKASAFGMGTKGMDILKQTLDSLAAPPAKNVTTSAGYIASTSGFPKEGLFISYISLGNLFKGAMELFGDEGMAPGGDMMMRMFEKISIAAYATKKENALVFGTKLPVSDFVGMWGQLMMGPPAEEEEETPTEEPEKGGDTKEEEE